MDQQQRPNPEALLAQIEAQEEHDNGGKLKIFLGAAPGVGKTYAMLQEAVLRKSQGMDVVVGLIETHGRQETGKLLTGSTAAWLLKCFKINLSVAKSRPFLWMLKLRKILLLPPELVWASSEA